jgi:zinc/manganese transport system substrate-binding protein
MIPGPWTMGLFLIICLLLAGCSGSLPPVPAPAGTISVVAAENFYGDIARQLGAGHVTVVSILSDPQVDPHEYESTVQNGVAVNNARLVIENGGGYDTWMDKLLAASPNPERILLVASDIAPDKLQDNPHVWYGIDNVRAIATNVTASLEKLDPAHKTDYDAALLAFQRSLEPIENKITAIKTRYAGTPVGLTETIFLYQTTPTGLRVLTPPEFQKAIAEGNDPPADAVISANEQLSGKQVRLLIYNLQTVTPVTTNLQDEAIRYGIPLVAVSESMPLDETYQSWMLDQLTSLEKALGG